MYLCQNRFYIMILLLKLENMKLWNIFEGWMIPLIVIYNTSFYVYKKNSAKFDIKYDLGIPTQ